MNYKKIKKRLADTQLVPQDWVIEAYNNAVSSQGHPISSWLHVDPDKYAAFKKSLGL